MTNDDSCSEQLATTIVLRPRVLHGPQMTSCRPCQGGSISLLALLITLMLTVRWKFSSPKSPSSTVTRRVPDPVPVKHMSTRQATDRSQTGSVRASPAMQNAASSHEVSSFVCSLVAFSTLLPCQPFRAWFQVDEYITVEDCVGGTPLVRLQRLPGQTSNIILAKLEGNNPAGSVKDR